MVKGEIYEIPSEVSRPGEPSTKRNSQLEKEEDIFDNPIRNDSNDDVMEEDDAFESCGEDTNDSRQFSSIKRSECSTHLAWKVYKSKLEVGDQDV
ncbi:hypothetical protein B9Z55_017369 [Caenorhabditis nigoni]|uniref:Uncharacterized protein n=1 Tax=Caenorhabditis nigoni TaxID=1611254 RepID=A0A2G5T991_9PELO|nr:hypothetical protein B9Z55_017369 [Caenorhabditis nigoni]